MNCWISHHFEGKKKTEGKGVSGGNKFWFGWIAEALCWAWADSLIRNILIWGGIGAGFVEYRDFLELPCARCLHPFWFINSSWEVVGGQRWLGYFELKAKILWGSLSTFPYSQFFGNKMAFFGGATCPSIPVPPPAGREGICAWAAPLSPKPPTGGWKTLLTELSWTFINWSLGRNVWNHFLHCFLSGFGVKIAPGMVWIRAGLDKALIGACIKGWAVFVELNSPWKGKFCSKEAKFKKKQLEKTQFHLMISHLWSAAGSLWWKVGKQIFLIVLALK